MAAGQDNFLLMILTKFDLQMRMIFWVATDILYFTLKILKIYTIVKLVDSKRNKGKVSLMYSEELGYKRIQWWYMECFDIFL